MFYEEVELWYVSWLLSLLLSVSETHPHLDNTGAMLIFMLEPEDDVKSNAWLVNTTLILSMQSQSSIRGEEYLSLRRKCWIYLLVCFRTVSGELAQNKEWFGQMASACEAQVVCELVVDSMSYHL